MVTARSEKDSVIEALQNGAVDYVIKPFDRDQIRSKIKAVCSRHEETVLHRRAQKRPIRLAAEVGMEITDITPQGCLILSSFPVAGGCVFFLTSDDLDHALGMPRKHRYAVRINECQPLEHGKFQYTASFVGQKPQESETIRKALLTGQFFSY